MLFSVHLYKMGYVMNLLIFWALKSDCVLLKWRFHTAFVVINEGTGSDPF